MEIWNLLDWSAIGQIIIADLLLGADNALMIGLAVAGLPLAMQKRAMMWGLAAAIGLRIFFLAISTTVMTADIPYLHLIAGSILLVIGAKLLLSHNEDNVTVDANASLFQAVRVIAIADLVMSLDNVLAVTAVATGVGHGHGTMYAIIGILISIPIILFGAKLVTFLMDRIPLLQWGGAGMLGWVGGDMIIKDPFVAAYLATVTIPMDVVYKFAGVVAVIFTAIAAQHYKKPVISE